MFIIDERYKFEDRSYNSLGGGPLGGQAPQGGAKNPKKGVHILLFFIEHFLLL
jgi:hypothetical protein